MNMALQKVGEQALLSVSLSDSDPKIKKKEPTKKVVDEDTFAEGLEKIIVREFYPDLPKLKAQTEYLEALEKNDVEKLRVLHIKYGSKVNRTKTPNIYSTPATFETPDAHQGQTPHTGPTDNMEPKPTDIEETHNPEPDPKKKKDLTDLNLDKYVNTVTSEDNASFAEILKNNEEKLRQKHGWLYEQEEEINKEKAETLALPSIEKQAIEEGPRTQRLEMWNYQAKNSLMYVPDGTDYSATEKIELTKGQPRVIVHKNTRFDEQPFQKTRSKDSITQAANNQAAALQGKIGVDGKEILPQHSPSVNGYGFVATPSPAPGVDESPLMTWGEIEGTPFRLDGGGTPRSTAGPSFRIPQVPRRDQLAHELAEKASMSHRAKKQEALRRVSALTTPSPKFGAARTDRLTGLSPAAQRLASNKLRIRNHTDKALQASYTPSPQHTPGAIKTPTPTRTPKTTPRLSQTPNIQTATPKRDNTDSTSSLTDNLLNIPKPKRSRAEDFF